MSTDGTRPSDDLAAVDAAFTWLDAVMNGLTDADARGPSRLPGWTRGHVLSHIARNADGQARMVEGVLRDEVVDQYPGGDEQRAGDIEAGADRSISVLVEDVRTSQAALVAGWDQVPADGWDRLTQARAGIRPVRAGVMSRWRELLVHLVDLDAGVGADQLPAAYVARDAEWLAQYRTRGTWSDAPW